MPTVSPAGTSGARRRDGQASGTTTHIQDSLTRGHGRHIEHALVQVARTMARTTVLRW